jgi:hypothetical protein
LIYTASSDRTVRVWSAVDVRYPSLVPVGLFLVN